MKNDVKNTRFQCWGDIPFIVGYRNYFWKKVPFAKLLIALIGGILVQWYMRPSIKIGWVILAISTINLSVFFFIDYFRRFRLIFLTGIISFCLFFSIGALLLWQNDIRHHPQWFAPKLLPDDGLVVRVDEPLVEKTKSLKANGKVDFIIRDEKKFPVKGSLIIYFKKDSLLPAINYGIQIIFKQPLQEIRNSGNPGGFDYKRFCLFQRITHQVFLQPHDFLILSRRKENIFRKFIYNIRSSVLEIIRKNIIPEKERGLAEALLIGYKNDLEQSLVQSYTNTGVVHIIAISGLHLGLIYWLLVRLFKPFKKRLKWLRALLIIAGLWLFSLLAGAQPSVLRSAVMFTCVVLGEGFGRKTSIFNTFAFSAFLLLCINPFWLWDVGFQLSYAAVLSIIIFFRPVYNWLYVKNKMLDTIWKLNAVTISAQILTIPLSIYHFHQFPNYFLLTNVIGVPLSSLIVLAEIFLCAIGWFPSLALFAGKIITWLIWLMNSWIEKIEKLPYSLWEGLQVSTVQMILLFLFILFISHWLMERAKRSLYIALVPLLIFFMIRSISFIHSSAQKKIIVYNIPQHSAIDFVMGRNYQFRGDSNISKDLFIRNFHLKPSRTQFRISGTSYPNSRDSHFLSFNNEKILIIDSTIHFHHTNKKCPIDFLILSGNPKIYISKLASSFNIKKVVFTSSVPGRKMSYWKKDCDSLHIPWYDVNSSGAFVMNLQ